MHGITCFSDSMCSFRTVVALELFGQKMAIFSAAEHKMEFNQYFSKAEKRTETPVEQHSSILEMENSPPYFPPSSPSLIRFRDPPRVIPSIPNTSSLIFEQVGNRK
ncbi:hypothetical protein CEXT_55331 [Caerostris extrusa]|uniref:Uncharacterized protein n=1 Tax=Caerostris extrusa TaxID=172846 RepID=A0AAV4TQM8_CAEEX|nr:hypothetical protein CEXT_55331 [Caerostris extrusa]